MIPKVMTPNRLHPNRAPSPKQKKIARMIIENLQLAHPLSGGDLVENSGYGKMMRMYPGRILESKGVKKELRELGFSVEAADQVIWKMLHKARKEETRIKAAQEVYKRLGAYEDTKQGAPKAAVVIVLPPEIIKKHGLSPSPTEDSEQ